VPRQRPSKNMKKRLHHLESLVLNMMNNGSPNESTTAPTQQVTPESESHSFGATDVLTQTQTNDTVDMTETDTAFGRVILNDNETTYVGATHWAAILKDIEEVKDYFDETAAEDTYGMEESYPLQNMTNQQQASAMFLGISKPANKAELLVSLPGRAVVDRLVSRYFNSNHPAMNLIHKPTFQKEYRDFWDDPYSKPVTWVGLLFAIMSLAMFFAHRAGDESIEPSKAAPMDLVHSYRTLCAQALVLGSYTKPGQYTIETLVLYFEGEFTMTGDAQARGWLLHGLTVRLALRMGLHRDASNHPNISAFQGEMRRRVWHLISQVDLLLSFHVGLPSMVSGLPTDTKPPLNLFDEDFDLQSTVLPPSRPETELTPMTYTICKARIATVFGQIADQANTLTGPTHPEVMAVDKSLLEAYESIPPVLMARSLDEAITDSPELIMQRFNIMLLFHKSRCVLHRRALSCDEKDPRFNYSRNSCIDSALELLHYQYEIHLASAPGGPLSRHRWYLNTLTIHDFLLASMIIYLHLTDGQGAPTTTYLAPSGVSTSKLQQEMINVLETSYDIWITCTTETGDAIRARGVIRNMLASLGRHGFTIRARSEPIGPNGVTPSIQMGASAADITNNTISSQPLQQLGSMIDMPVNLDWVSIILLLSIPLLQMKVGLQWNTDFSYRNSGILV
jgi:hypothetical protein